MVFNYIQFISNIRNSNKDECVRSSNWNYMKDNYFVSIFYFFITNVKFLRHIAHKALVWSFSDTDTKDTKRHKNVSSFLDTKDTKSDANFFCVFLCQIRHFFLQF